ncbi:MAG: hypothetical protein KIT60_15930 [Burkholderiaceae bacterium]|nr:hypothetical protein [Burkholderiaceae bacterium]
MTPGFTGTLDWAAGASGVGAGADGQGGVGIQPALGASPIVGARVTVRRADGSVIGRADTGADGRVTLKACDAEGPFLIEAEGAASASYFDAAKGAAGASAPFGDGEVLRVAVTALTANIGVTAATEAVVHRLLGPASSNASRNLPSTAAIGDANRLVLDGAWGPLWPQAFALDSLTLMPGQAQAPTLGDKPSDRYALALSALGYGAAQFNATLVAPSLAAARQFAADAADGRIDGRDPNGALVAAAADTAYDPGQMRIALDAALTVAARTYADSALRTRVPAVLALGAMAAPNGGGGYTTQVVRLGSDGTVVLLNSDGSAGTTLATDVVSLASASQPPASALFMKRVDGSVWAAGTGGAPGLLGLGANQDRATAAEVTALRGASAISVGLAHALARVGDGSVLGWGDGTRGQLIGGVSSVQPTAQAGVSSALAVLALNDLSFALRQDGRVLSWGTGADALGTGDGTRRLQAQAQAVLTGPNAPLDQVLAIAGFAGSSDATLAALRTDGSVWTWGENTHGGLGTTGAARAVAAAVTGVANIVGLAATDRGFIAVDTRGALFFWGSVPVSGSGTATTYSDPIAPQQLDGLTGVRDVLSAFPGLYQARVLTAGGERWRTDGSSARQVTPDTELDTRPIAAGILTIAPVSGDDLVNAAERNAGVTVSGSISEADRPVAVDIGSSPIAAQVSGKSWTAVLPTAGLPTGGQVTLNATFVTVGGISSSSSRTFTVDAVAPTVTVTDNVPGTANATVTFTFTWSEPPVAFGPDSVSVSGGTKGTFAQTSATTFTLPVTPPANSVGEVAVTVGQGVVRDAAGNPSAGPVTASQSYKTDTTAPTVAINVPAGLVTGPVTVGFVWSEAISGFTADDVSVTNASKGALVQVDSLNFTIELTPPASNSGVLTVAVPAGAARDAADNASVAAQTVSRDFDTTIVRYDYSGAGGGEGGSSDGAAGDGGAPGTLPGWFPPNITAATENAHLRITWDRHPWNPSGDPNHDPNADVAYYLVLRRADENSPLTKFANAIPVTAATPSNARFSVLLDRGSTVSYRIRACNKGSGNPELNGGGGLPGQNWCSDSPEFRSDGTTYPPEHFYPDTPLDREDVEQNGARLSVSIGQPSGVQTAPFNVTFFWNTPVGEFRADDVSVDRGTISNFAGSGRSYSVLVTPPRGSSGTLVLSVRAGAVRSVVPLPDGTAHESELTTAQFSINTPP